MEELEKLRLDVEDFVKSAEEFIAKMKEREQEMSELNEMLRKLAYQSGKEK